jgi:hypothetical protein
MPLFKVLSEKCMLLLCPITTVWAVEPDKSDLELASFIVAVEGPIVSAEQKVEWTLEPL